MEVEGLIGGAGAEIGGAFGAHTLLLNLLNFPIAPPSTVSITFMISVLTGLWSARNFIEDSIINPNPSLMLNYLQLQEAEQFDFIIVGGGSSGSVIANRLSANGEYSVLVLEAGGDPSLLNHIPELAPYNLHQKTMDWKFLTEPQNNACLGIEDRRLAWPRGKVLGGCSILNFMMYQRGNPKSFDEWAEATGDPQWRYQNVLEYFKKSEDYHGNYPDERFHGTKGPLYISKQYFQPTINEWVEAGRELGYESKSDPNGYQTEGFWPTDVTIKEGFRESTYRAFLEPVLGRRNLKIYRFAHVTKINLENGKAVGVTYSRDGRTISVKASKEVIISAGAIGTPQLLMLSGIGSSKHLESLGISTKVDLPGVGQNLQDHVMTLVGPFLLNSSVSFIPDRDMTVGSAWEFFHNRTGPFSSNEVGGIGFISSTPGSNPVNSYPNIEFHQLPLGLRASVGDDFTRTFGLKSGLLNKFYAPYLGSDANFVLVDLGRPLSKGEILLKSSNPFEHPLINPKYFEKYEDMQAMIDGFKFLIKFYEETKVWQKLGAKLIPTALPGCEHLELRSDAYLECYIRHITLTIYHPCCTVRMGRKEDPNAVVDSYLKVFGMKGLRIGDASIMPQITNANLNAPSILIGEKLSDFILKDWNKKL